MYGFYSQEAADAGCNVAVWETTTGDQVKITFATDDIEGKTYRWIDKKFVGEVTKCVGIAQIHPDFAQTMSDDLTVGQISDETIKEIK